MAHCRKCDAKDRKLHAQGVLIDAQKKELEVERERSRRLEEALHKACDYSEVCQHFPGRELLEAAE